jgi:hypothetical protein
MMGDSGPVRRVIVGMLSPSGPYAASASSRSRTPAIMSMQDFAATPGIAVDPM